MGVKSEKLALTGSLTEMLVGMLLLIEFHSAWAQCHWGEEWRIEPSWARSCLLGRPQANENTVYTLERDPNGCVEKETRRMPHANQELKH